MAWLLALLGWLISAAVLAPVCLFVTMVLAGPHSSMLPSAIQPIVLLLGWVSFIVGPIWIARVVWRRTAARRAGAVESS